MTLRASLSILSTLRKSVCDLFGRFFCRSNSNIRLRFFFHLYDFANAFHCPDYRVIRPTFLLTYSPSILLSSLSIELWGWGGVGGWSNAPRFPTLSNRCYRRRSERDGGGGWAAASRHRPGSRDWLCLAFSLSGELLNGHSERLTSFVMRCLTVSVARITPVGRSVGSLYGAALRKRVRKYFLVFLQFFPPPMEWHAIN